MRTSIKVAGGLAVLLVAASLLSQDERIDAQPRDAGTFRSAEAPRPADSPTAASASTSAAPPAEAAVAATALLQASDGGDGDSWKDSAGREYRLGLVNAPENDECYGSIATRERRALTAGGFRADVYEVDRFGRSVAVVSTADGINLNVHLARNGFADDRYLEQFRSENPSLAAQLDAAFAAARADRAGLWGGCAPATEVQGFAAPAPAPVAALTPAPAANISCHPDYLTCIPVQGNGSGAGAANDLDCGDLRKPVRLRQVGVDPYRLDSNSDGDGCESYA